MDSRAAFLLFAFAAVPAWAQNAATPDTAAPAPAVAPAPAAAPTAAADSAPAAKPAPLVLYFGTGSSSIRPEDMKTLDQASRLYREGHPIVMVVSGATDMTGSPAANLALSQARAETVLHALVSRGIPEARFQVLAKGETDPAVPTPAGTANQSNRRVEISWR